MNLSDLAIRRPVTTAMFFIGTGLLGFVSLDRLPVELLPEVVYPEIFVSLVQPTLAPEQAERQLLLPAEGAVGALEGVVAIESTAAQGRAMLQISFSPGADMKFALLQVQSRMDRLQPTLPELTQIAVQRFDTSILTSAVMEIQVLGEGDINWLREYTELNIRQQIEAVDGVVSAAPLGGQRRAVEVILDQDMLEAHRITPSRLRNAVNSVNRPRAYLGNVVSGNQEYPVSLHGQFTSLDQIRDVVLDETVPLKLGDVARVRFGLQERADLSRVNGLSAVSIRVLKEDEANLIDVSDEVVATVERLNTELAPAGIQLVIGTNQADLMQEALDTLVQAAIIGLFLGLAVLFLFLRNLRFVAVLVVAIPTSLLLTFNLMYAWDLSLNVLSLCGLALAMGMLADNGIVVLESIFKHFEQGKSPADAARDGTADVRRAVVASTATTAMVFLPVVFIQTDFQDILRDLSLSIVFPLLASLLVAVTLVPMLGSRTLARTAPAPLATGRLLEIYTILLKAGLRHRIRVSVFLGVAVLGTLIAAFFLMLQQETVQAQSQFPIYVDMPDGSTLEATDDVVRRVEAAVAEHEAVAGFTTSVQEAQGQITVTLLDLDERPGQLGVTQIQEQLAREFDDIGEAVVGYDPPGGGGAGGGGGRISPQRRGGFSLDMSTPAELGIIRGEDLATLQMIAEDLQYRLEEIEEIDPGSILVDVERSGPEVQIVPDPVSMFDRSVETGTVLAAIGDANVDGFTTVTPFLERDGTETVIEIRPTEDPESSGLQVADLRRLPVLTPAGDTTPLEEVARVRTDEGRRAILRSDQSRRVLVEYSFLQEVLDSQRRLDAARRTVRGVTQSLALPSGYSLEILEGEVDTIYYWMMGIAALLVYMILAALFESFSSPVVVFCTLPPAIVGSCWALILTGSGLTSSAGPMALLGLVVLIGIAVNNGIILIDAISALRRRGFRRQRAVLVAGRSRVRPIVMTSATTLLGVLPLALEFGGDFEIWPPFAITILGGLTVSLVSTLIFIPVAYLGIDQMKEWLRDIGLIGVSLATLATAGAIWGFWLRYESRFWTWLLVVPAWFAFLSLVWLVLRIHHTRVVARRDRDPIQRIRLHTLTKHYGAPGRFRREWARFERRGARRRAAGRPPVSRAARLQGLTWQLPLLGLAGFLHAYLDSAVWLYLLTLATWPFLLWLARSLAALRRSYDDVVETGSRTQAGWMRRIARRGPGLGRLALAIAVFAYLQLRLGLLSVTIATIVMWLTARIIRWLAHRVETGKVVPDSFTGRLRWVRRRIYGLAARVPVLGVEPEPFRALVGVNLEIGQGMFGLLGPNGAGKTTLMRIVCQVLRPTHGSVSLDGVRLDEFGSLHGIIGYLPQRFGLYDEMSARQYLEYRALLEGFRDREERDERVRWCLEQVHLTDRQDDRIGDFSGGMRQRVGIAQTLLHAPRIVVVDEPTAGLDPVERIRFRNLLARLSRDRIVIFSTHIVEDIAGSCNQLAVLGQGRVLYEGTPASMRALAEGRVWEVVVQEEELDRLEQVARVVTQVRTPEGIRVRYLAPEPAAEAPSRSSQATLEDAYVYLLERQRGLAW